MSNLPTDIYLYRDAPARSVAFPGPVVLDAAQQITAEALLARCEAFPQDDFTFQHEGTTWRARRDRFAVDGLWYRLRRLANAPPRLDALPSPMAPRIAEMLMSARLREGGLIYITGAAGSGKTTTASATVISRLHRFGGVAYTIEDPPELPLNGWHGPGWCSQTEVAGEQAADWAESFRGALRSQPSATAQMLFVGEIRNRESAQMMLQAAANGFLVIATGFGSDVVSAIDALLRLTGEAESGMLANLLRLVVFQRLQGGMLRTTALASSDASSPVAARIRSGQTVHLLDDVRQQEMQLMRGQLPLEA
jgi:type II secretory ATPase GspE/PulE/Tfp pilus assembly ATPase PilB-like protein